VVVLKADYMNSSPAKKMYANLAERMKAIAENDRFNGFITSVIVLAGLLVGLNTEESIQRDYKGPLDAINHVILAIFIVEFLVKFLAEGFEPWRYFFSSWNCFDFFIVLGGILGAARVFQAQSVLMVLRLLRLLRVLKVLKAFPQLQVIVTALVKGFGSIGFIGVILGLFFYMFSIIAMIIFRDNDPFHFGDLHLALLTLFRAATLEDWTDIMYINMYGCDRYGYDWPTPNEMGCNKPYAYGIWAVLFFICFIIIGALVILTLFIGVVTTAMEEATDAHKVEEELMGRVREFAEQNDISPKIIDLYRIVFDMLDLDGGGNIEQEELKVGLSSISDPGQEPKDEWLMEKFAVVDKDKSGEIDFAEFVTFMTITNLDGAPDDDAIELTMQVSASGESANPLPPGPTSANHAVHNDDSMSNAKKGKRKTGKVVPNN